MERCLVCKAKLKGKMICHRCRADFSALETVEKKASEHFLSAGKCHDEGAYDKMLYHARRSFSLRKNSETLTLMMRACILNKAYDDALSLWRTYSRDSR